MSGQRDFSEPRATRSQAFRVSVVILGAVLLVGVALSAVSVLRWPPWGAGIGPSPLPSSPVASESARPPTATTPASPDGGTGMLGDLPPPDAKAPPGTTYIPGLRAEALWNSLISQKFECRSAEGAYPDGDPPGWSILCTRTADGAETTVTAPYWAFDRVVAIHVTVLPHPIDGSIPAAVSRQELDAVLEAAQAALGGSTARDWALDRIGADACRQTPCQREVGQTRLSVQSGQRGSGTLTIDGLAIVEG